MEQKKFLRYCPVCNNYNEDTGACSYIHENVQQYPEKFIKYCDGKYLSLITGKAILTIDEINEEVAEAEAEAEVNEDEMLLVSVFTTKNNALFQVARTILEDNKIEYYTAGDYVNVLNPAVYDTDIKVLEKDEKVARKLLSEITPDIYEPKDALERKMLSLHWYWNIVIIALFIILIIFLLSLLKK